MPLDKLREGMIEILRSGSRASAETCESTVDEILKVKEGDHYHGIRVRQVGSKLISFVYTRGSEMNLGGKPVVAWHADAATLKKAQKSRLLSNASTTYIPQEDKDGREMWYIGTIVSPITSQTMAKIFVDVFPSTKYPTLNSFPDEIRQMYIHAKEQYPGVTHVSDFVMKKPTAWQPNTVIDESRLDENGRFFLQNNPLWRDQHVILFCMKLGADNWRSRL